MPSPEAFLPDVKRRLGNAEFTGDVSDGRADLGLA
jgi:hypothetical protein